MSELTAQQRATIKPTVSLAKNSLVYFISIAYIDHPVWRGHRDAAKRGPPCGHRITRGWNRPIMRRRGRSVPVCNGARGTLAHRVKRAHALSKVHIPSDLVVNSYLRRMRAAS